MIDVPHHQGNRSQRKAETHVTLDCLMDPTDSVEEAMPSSSFHQTKDKLIETIREIGDGLQSKIYLARD
jgi:hypothetical protein